MKKILILISITFLITKLYSMESKKDIVIQIDDNKPKKGKSKKNRSKLNEKKNISEIFQKVEKIPWIIDIENPYLKEENTLRGFGQNPIRSIKKQLKDAEQNNNKFDALKGVVATILHAQERSHEVSKTSMKSENDKQLFKQIAMLIVTALLVIGNQYLSSATS